MFDLLVILLGIILLAIIRAPIRKSDFVEPPKTRRTRRKSGKDNVAPLPWFDPNYKKRQEEKRRREEREFRGEINDYWSDYD